MLSCAFATSVRLVPHLLRTSRTATCPSAGYIGLGALPFSQQRMGRDNRNLLSMSHNSGGEGSDDASVHFKQFMDTRKSLVLATVNEEGMPHASTTPFVLDESRNFYVFVSGLSEHTGHLSAEGAKASVLLLADESSTTEPFARTRATFDCDVSSLPRGTNDFEVTADNFAASFGEIIDVLRGLGDFVIFRLKPRRGRFVMGFARAYNVADDWQSLVHVRPRAEQ